MPTTTDACLGEPGPHTPEERRREVAAILAKGLLRLRTPLECLAEPDAHGQGNIPKELSESDRNCLDESAPPRLHVPAG